MLILFSNGQAMLRKQNITLLQTKVQPEDPSFSSKSPFQEERLVGAYSTDGCLSFVLSLNDLSGIRLNLDCQAGDVTLLIESADTVVAEITLSGIDETDWYWPLDEHLADHAMQLDTLVATVYLRHAVIYAIEVIQQEKEDH